jgi:hypothetical protein
VETLASVCVVYLFHQQTARVSRAGARYNSTSRSLLGIKERGLRVEEEIALGFIVFQQGHSTLSSFSGTGFPQPQAQAESRLPFTELPHLILTIRF